MSDKEVIAELSSRLLIAERRIEEYKLREKWLYNHISGMGSPLNDNLLEFNKDQQMWAYEILLQFDLA